MSWTCATCGREEPDLPLCFGAEAPWRELGVEEAEFDARVELSDDQSIVDDEVFLLRGHLALPIVGSEDALEFSVWCSLSKESFRHVSDRWDDPERVEDAYFGWLCTSLPGYPDTMELETTVRSREVGVVASVELSASEHPLYVDQRAGLTRARLEEIVHEILHVD